MDSTDFLGSRLSLGLSPWELALLVLPSQGEVLLGWTMLASWEAVLSQVMPPWELELLVLPS